MTSPLQDQFRMLVKYNHLANHRLLEACSRLSADALQQPSAAPFSTIPGLLEHVLASDEVWLARFAGNRSAGFRPGPPATRNLEDFRIAREAMDLRIDEFVDGLSDEELMHTICVINSRKEETCAPLAQFLSHMFNHQTHHRGQVQVLLRAGGVMGVALDLHRLLAEQVS